MKIYSTKVKEMVQLNQQSHPKKLRAGVPNRIHVMVKEWEEIVRKIQLQRSLLPDNIIKRISWSNRFGRPNFNSPIKADKAVDGPSISAIPSIND